MNIHWQVQWLELLCITKPNIIEKRKLYHLIQFFFDSNKGQFDTIFCYTTFFLFWRQKLLFYTNHCVKQPVEPIIKIEKDFGNSFVDKLIRNKRRKNKFFSIPQNCLMLTIICIKYKSIWSTDENNFARSEICLSENAQLISMVRISEIQWHQCLT